MLTTQSKVSHFANAIKQFCLIALKDRVNTTRSLAIEYEIPHNSVNVNQRYKIYLFTGYSEPLMQEAFTLRELDSVQSRDAAAKMLGVKFASFIINSCPELSTVKREIPVFPTLQRVLW